jgi:hypothetical protein
MGDSVNGTEINYVLPFIVLVIKYWQACTLSSEKYSGLDNLDADWVSLARYRRSLSQTSSTDTFDHSTSPEKLNDFNKGWAILIHDENYSLGTTILSPFVRTTNAG